MRSINLLDKRHYNFTEEELLKSAQSGSLLAKSHYIVVRSVAPTTEFNTKIPQQENAIFTTKPRSSVKIEQVNYEELNVSDDQYAVENAELAEQDHLGKWTK